MDSWIAVRLAVVIQLWREPVETSVTVSLLRNNGFSSGESAELTVHLIAGVTLEIEAVDSGEGMMKGAPIDVQSSIFQLSRIDAEAPNVVGDD